MHDKQGGFPGTRPGSTGPPPPKQVAARAVFQHSCLDQLNLTGSYYHHTRLQDITINEVTEPPT